MIPERVSQLECRLRAQLVGRVFFTLIFVLAAIPSGKFGNTGEKKTPKVSASMTRANNHQSIIDAMIGGGFPPEFKEESSCM